MVNPPDINDYTIWWPTPMSCNVYDDPGYVAVRDELMRRLYAHLEASGDNFRHWMATMFRVR